MKLDNIDLAEYPQYIRKGDSAIGTFIQIEGVTDWNTGEHLAKEDWDFDFVAEANFYWWPNNFSPTFDNLVVMEDGSRYLPDKHGTLVRFKSGNTHVHIETMTICLPLEQEIFPVLKTEEGQWLKQE